MIHLQHRLLLRRRFSALAPAPVAAVGGSSVHVRAADGQRADADDIVGNRQSVMPPASGDDLTVVRALVPLQFS